MTKVKICGITNIEDAVAAVDAGADLLGFVFAESPRKVDAETVKSILDELPSVVTTVGVFANQSVQEISAQMREIGLHLAQLHGEVIGGRCSLAKELGCRRIIRGLRVASIADIEQISKEAHECNCAAFLLDAHVEGLMGGTGRTFDWDLAIRAKELHRPIILAGGLTPDNVAEAVRKVSPAAVDVSSGVELSPGKKDHKKIREFINNAKNL